MDIGISSASFYPEKVEVCLKRVGELGAKTAEIFFNCPCETEAPIIDELIAVQRYYDIQIRSIHPFTSAIESLLFFSTYDRRKDDAVEYYKRYFDTLNRLGGEFLVFHGGSYDDLPEEQYAEDYLRLSNAAREQGVFVAHENVRRYTCRNVDYMKKVADFVGEDFRMVLDTKQCRRSGQDEFEFIRLLGDKIAQIHISDFDDENDCLAPGQGNYDFKKLFTALKSAGYDNSALIELYRSNFDSPEDLKKSMDYLKGLF